MAGTDLDAPARVSCSIAVKSPSGFRCCCVSAALTFSLAFTGAANCRPPSHPAQDQDQVPGPKDQKEQTVADAARQEHARKQNQPKKFGHVYTAEDLKRDQILTPEDRAELEARKNRQPASPANPQDAIDGLAGAQDAHAASSAAEVPLGDVARRFRKQKQAEQLERSAQFPLPFADAPALASPRPPVQPLLPPVTVAPPTVVQPAPRVVAPLRPFVKRSPFERPRVLPAPPVVAAPHELAPVPLPPRALPAPLPARVAPLAAISGKLILVTVKPGDSLWKFAAARLGDGHRWQELLALNPGLRNPDVLEVGSQIVVPASVAPPRVPVKYTARRGDTLWTIAESQLRRGTAWSCIAQANPDLRDTNLIHEGQVLLLPSSCPR
jgi:nucleoid-associated protein YgaU